MTRAPGRRFAAVATIGLAIVAMGGCSSAPSPDRPASIQVAAASDLRPVFELLEAVFERAHNVDVGFTFGSSGQLREQILNGAPFDVFASANVAFVDDIIAAERGEPTTKSVFAQGLIVLVAAPGVARPDSIDDLGSNAYRRVAIANPAHAPYGIAAEQAIETARLDETLRGRLVIGETVADAYRLVTSGNADAGIVAISLAIAADHDYRAIPDDSYEPIRQGVVATGNSDNPATLGAAREFVAFLTTDDARAALQRFGFAVDGFKR